MDWESSLVIHLLVAARLLLPLLIPRYPLFGILACMMLDSADQGIMQVFGVHLLGYQSYDKALDVYYLAIAYLATMRNWENLPAFQISRVLFYLRLIGVLLFELTGARWVLVVFANAFEPFFVYYEIVRRRGSPMLLTRNASVVVVAVIWFVFKLPHEWWIHIAQMDTTDFIKTKILGATVDTPLWQAIIQAPVVTGALTFVAAILGLGLWEYMRVRKRRRAQAGAAPEAAKGWRAHWTRPAPSAASHTLRAAEQIRTTLRLAILRGRTASTVRPAVLVEKIVLVTLIVLVFQQVLPGLEANGIHTALFIVLAIMATDFLLRWVIRRFGVPPTPSLDLLITGVLNFCFVILFQLIIPLIPPKYNVVSALIFAALITFFVMLYDHYRPIYDYRAVNIEQPEAGSEAPAAQPGGAGR